MSSANTTNQGSSNVKEALDFVFSKFQTLMAKDIKLNSSNFPNDKTVENALDTLQDKFSDIGDIDNHNLNPNSHEDLREEISHKINMDTSIAWFIMPFQNRWKSISASASYGKDSAGNVHVNCSIGITRPIVASELTIAIMPEGFRPTKTLTIPYTALQSVSNVTRLQINTIGAITFSAIPDTQTTGTSLFEIDIIFKTV